MNTPKQILRKKVVRDTTLQVIAAEDGYTYKSFRREGARWNRLNTKGLNLHISMNAGLQLTWDQWDEIVAMVAEMRQEIQDA